MHRKHCARSATIFSRVKAAPPPLIMWPRGSISSAPSTYSGSRSTSLASSTRMPWPCRRTVLALLLDTAPAMPSRSVASASMKWFTVDPVPTPMMLPGSTCVSAAWATMAFISSWVMTCPRVRAAGP